MRNEYNFFNELFKFNNSSKKDIYNKYVQGYITKEELDKYMEERGWKK